MVFRMKTRSGSKKFNTAKLGLNVDREVLLSRRTTSIALIELHSPLVTLNSDELRTQITEIADALLLRRAQVLQ